MIGPGQVGPGQAAIRAAINRAIGQAPAIQQATAIINKNVPAIAAANQIVSNMPSPLPGVMFRPSNPPAVPIPAGGGRGTVSKAFQIAGQAAMQATYLSLQQAISDGFGLDPNQNVAAAQAAGQTAGNLVQQGTDPVTAAAQAAAQATIQSAEAQGMVNYAADGTYGPAAAQAAVTLVQQAGGDTGARTGGGGAGDVVASIVQQALSNAPAPSASGFISGVQQALGNAPAPSASGFSSVAQAVAQTSAQLQAAGGSTDINSWVGLMEQNGVDASVIVNAYNGAGGNDALSAQENQGDTTAFFGAFVQGLQNQGVDGNLIVSTFQQASGIAPNG